MHSTRILTCAIVLAALATGGCRSNKPPASPTAPRAADTDAVQAVREKYFRAYPDSRVGVVTAARPQDQLVSVGEIQSEEFRENQIVTFLDGDQRILTTGTVVRILPESIHVRYHEPASGGREPRTGDIMVRVPAGATTL